MSFQRCLNACRKTDRALCLSIRPRCARRMRSWRGGRDFGGLRAERAVLSHGQMDGFEYPSNNAALRASAATFGSAVLAAWSRRAISSLAEQEYFPAPKPSLLRCVALLGSGCFEFRGLGFGGFGFCRFSFAASALAASGFRGFPLGRFGFAASALAASRFAASACAAAVGCVKFRRFDFGCLQFGGLGLFGLSSSASPLPLRLCRFGLCRFGLCCFGFGCLLAFRLRLLPLRPFAASALAVSTCSAAGAGRVWPSPARPYQPSSAPLRGRQTAQTVC